MDRFEDLRTFVRVVESGGISTAADQLNVAKSAVSRRVSDLETRLGAQLLIRTTRHVRPTETGQAFYNRAVRLLADLEEAETAVADQQGDLAGMIRVAVPLSFGLKHVGPLLLAFMAEHPAVEIDVDFADRRVDLLEEGFDVGLRIGHLQDSSLIARAIAPIRFAVCASPSYWERWGRPDRPEDLKKHRALRYRQITSGAVWPFRAPDGHGGSVTVPATLTANNGDFLMDAAVQGLGVIREPTFILSEALVDGRLEAALTAYHWDEVRLYAVYPPTRHLSPRVRALIDFLAERLGPTPAWDRPLWFDRS